MADRESKTATLRANATLNPRPETVRDRLFLAHDFFDPNDLLQVKYEMLRRVSAEGLAVSEAAARFGFSRPSFYNAKTAFDRQGLAGLLARKRGPKGAHKLTTEVMAFVAELLDQAPRPTIDALQARLLERFGLRVHRRSLQRAMRRQEKKPRRPPTSSP